MKTLCDAYHKEFECHWHSILDTLDRVLTSHQCSLGSIFSAWCHLSVEFVFGSHLALKVFSGPSGFPSSGHKNTVAQKGQSQISLPKQKSISQNTNQFTKTQNNFPKHKSISQNTNQFTKTQINFSKHKPISSKHKSVYQNTNQFLKTQTNFVETQIKRLGTCSVIIREPR